MRWTLLSQMSRTSLRSRYKWGSASRSKSTSDCLRNQSLPDHIITCWETTWNQHQRTNLLRNLLLIICNRVQSGKVNRQGNKGIPRSHHPCSTSQSSSKRSLMKTTCQKRSRVDWEIAWMLAMITSQWYRNNLNLRSLLRMQRHQIQWGLRILWDNLTLDTH